MLGFDAGDNQLFWAEFRMLKARGLDGVKLVISDACSEWNKVCARQALETV